MKVFLSWSGPRSEAVAVVLGTRLVDVVHSVDMWVSTTSIPGGAEWYAEIKRAAKECAVAIVVVTPENQGKPWLNFEAGAFALSDSKAIPLLVGFGEHDIVSGPLQQLEAERLHNRERMRTCLTELAPEGHERAAAERAFDHFWDEIAADCEQAFTQAAPAEDEVIPPPPSPADVTGDMMALLQSIDRRLVERSSLVSAGERLSMDYHPSRQPATRTQVRRLGDLLNALDDVASPALPPSWHHSYDELRALWGLVVDGRAGANLTESAYSQAVMLHQAALQMDPADLPDE